VPEEKKYVSSIKKHVIEDFLNDFTNGKKKGTTISTRTLKRKLATIKSVYRSLYDDDFYQGSNPTRQI
jgi:site-specific recombinase XerD